MSEKPRSVGRESRSPAQEGSSKTLYEPLWPTETPNEASKGASARAPPQHTDPNEVSFKRKDQEATSKGSHSPDRWNVHRGIKYTSRTSQTEDSQRVIANLRQEARGRTPIKENPRNRVNASKRGNPEYSNYEESPDTSGSQKAREMDTLLTMKLQDNEIIKNYSIQYWETYNDIDGRSEEVAIKAFKLGLPVDSGLRHSLVKHQPSSLVKLMNKIDRFVCLEEDGKGTTPTQTNTQPKVFTPKPPVRSSPAVKSLSGPKDFATPSFRAFGTVFKEPIYRLIEKIKREPFFTWPPKLIGNPDSRDTKLYCNYHKDTGHMTENCHKLKVHLEHLATEGHLDQYIDTKLSKMKGPSTTSEQPNTSDTVAAGIIHVIHDPLCSIVSTGSYRSQMQKAAHLRRSFSIVNSVHPAPICSVSGGVMEQVISFSDSDLKDVQLPHNDPLVVTLRIGNYDVERILIDQGSFAEESLSCHWGKLSCQVLAGPVNLQTEFIIVNASSPYNAIMGRDWLHRMRAIPSTLHQKLRFPTKDGVMELSGDQEPEEGEVLMTEQPEKVFFDPSSPEQFFLVGSKLSAIDREQLLQVLISNQDVFAWSVYDAPGVSPELVYHSLNIGSEHRPIVSETAEVGPKKGLNSFGGGGTPSGIWSNPRNTVPNMALKHGGGATYQRMVTKMFGHIIGKIVGGLHRRHARQKSQRGKPYSRPTAVSRRGIEPNPGPDCCPCRLSRTQEHQTGTTPDWNGSRPRPLYLKGIKAYLSTPPCLSISHLGEQLFLYLAVSDHAVSAVLVREFGQEQKPVFFRQQGNGRDRAESNKVTVLSDLPLKMLLQRSDFSGRITKWGVYLGSLGVEYKPRAAIKGQVLAEFLAEFQYDSNNPSLTIPAEAQLGLVTGKWELFVDGASNSKGSGAGVVLVSPKGLILEQAVRLKFSASNNEAEYEALLISHRTVEGLSACHLQVFCDSQLVANQVSGEYQARDERMSAYLATVRLLLEKFESVHVAQIGREHNSLCRCIGQTSHDVGVRCTADSLYRNSGPTKLLESKNVYRKEAKIIKRKAPKYWVSKEGLLYRRSFTGPYLLCVRPEMIQNFLFEIHEEICGSHTGGRLLAHRAISQGYWWPYMQADALKYVRRM
uniref:RNase H type-1 domain-containing protein n=1 Tax=Fagus sylvatica TaxID=28930 RepID=A0A2N9IAX1_FAGSY